MLKISSAIQIEVITVTIHNYFIEHLDHSATTVFNFNFWTTWLQSTLRLPEGSINTESQCWEQAFTGRELIDYPESTFVIVRSKVSSTKQYEYSTDDSSKYFISVSTTKRKGIQGKSVGLQHDFLKFSFWCRPETKKGHVTSLILQAGHKSTSATSPYSHCILIDNIWRVFFLKM